MEERRAADEGGEEAASRSGELQMRGEEAASRSGERRREMEEERRAADERGGGEEAASCSFDAYFWYHYLILTSEVWACYEMALAFAAC